MPRLGARLGWRTLSIAVLGVLISPALMFAHPDDPKPRDRQPVYRGPGFRLADAAPGEQALVYPSEDGAVAPEAAQRDGRAPEGTTFPAVGVSLQSWITVPEFGVGANSANDCWGYVSPSGREYAILGLENATSFIEVTDPTNPNIVATIAGVTSVWRDIKVFDHYAYAVSEGPSGGSGGGIQVFDLQSIDSGVVTELPSVLTGGTSKTHNVVVDTDSGYLYRVGGCSTCGMRIYSLADPAAPAYITDWSDRYVHDAQVVTYDTGPYAGKQIAFLCSGLNGGSVDTGVDIVDVTDKQNMVNLSRIEYVGREYSHQAWLSPDRQFLFLNDELDEDGGLPTVLHVFDVSDLSNPQEVARFDSGTTSIGHNVYTKDDLLFAANYRSGLRVFDISDPLDAEQVAYFDTYPQDDNANFNSLWSNYPLFPSGTIIGSDMEKGLFVWRMAGIATFPEGRPQMLNADGQSVAVDLESFDESIQAGSEMLVYDTGAGPVSVPLTALEDGSYEAPFPSLPCGSVVQYHIEATTQSGVDVRNPAGPPGRTWETLVVFEFDDLFTDDFESDAGWSSASIGATSGAWERGVPVNDPDWAYDPDSDADGSGQCYLTQNALGNTDVDNGAVELTSPELDLTDGDVMLSYAYFLRLSLANGGNDALRVEITSDEASGLWTTIALHETDTGFNWRWQHISQAELEAAGVSLTDTMRVRFTANDSAPAGIVEAGVDAVSVRRYSCGSLCPADCSADGAVGVDDLLTILGDWGTSGAACDPAPPGGDGVIDINDLLAVLAQWGPCDP